MLILHTVRFYFCIHHHHAHTHAFTSDDWMWSSAASPSNLVTFCNFFRLQWNDNEIKRKLSLTHAHTHSCSHSHNHEGEWSFVFLAAENYSRCFCCCQIQWIICCFALYYNNYVSFFLFLLVNHACMWVNTFFWKYTSRMSSFAVVNHESDFSMHTKSVFVHVHTRKFAGAHVCVCVFVNFDSFEFEFHGDDHWTKWLVFYAIA